MIMAHGPPHETRMIRGARWLSVLGVLCAACPGSTTRRPDAAPQTGAPEPAEIAESLYDSGLNGAWQDSGTAVRELSRGAPAKVRFGIADEWILVRPGLGGHYGGVLFRVKEPIGEGEFLEVLLGSADRHAFPGVKLKPDHRTELGDGWTQVFVPIAELDPDGAPFDRIVLRPFRPFGNEWVLLDKIALAKVSAASVATAAPPQNPGPPPGGMPNTARVRIACDAKTIKISPYIYGVSYGEEGWSTLGVSVRRWGGNASTRYNWQSNFSNRSQDWFFENAPEPPYTAFMAESTAHQALSAIAVPMIGWVAKDAKSYSFPVSVFGSQSSVDPYRTDSGNGVSATGTKITPGSPTRTSIEAPPEWVKAWVSTIRASDAKKGQRSVYEYILDNEPMLWDSTQRDVHPDPVGYDELLDRTIQYGSAVRAADPDALIAGPAEWGWSGYFFSAKDLSGAGVHSDRLLHGNVPLAEWYLRKLRAHEQETGVRILDVFDLHYYPQANNVFGGGAGGSDRDTQLLRLRSTRSLWDPKYVDESWIKDTVRLLPRMKEWVDANYPGRGISLGEWNFGGEKDVTGALATAEALGRFAQFAVTSAYYWLAPPTGSSSRFGFLAYRNFDGHGGRFLDWYVPVTTEAAGASFFASRDADGKHMVVVAINLAPDAPMAVNLDFSACGAVASQDAYVYSGSAGGFGAAQPATPVSAASVERVLAPWSITVFDIRLGQSDHSP
jgi:hypothetical protein